VLAFIKLTFIKNELHNAQNTVSRFKSQPEVMRAANNVHHQYVTKR